MKKTISILILLAIAISLVAGCGNHDTFGDGARWDIPTATVSPSPATEAVLPSLSAEIRRSAPVLHDAMFSFEAAEDGMFDDDDWRFVPFTESDEFAVARESTFRDVRTSPLSTFSVSVNTASYSIMRRQIMSGREPNGIRIEELINYFDYDYMAPLPGSEHPFSIFTEVAASPWSPGHLLAKVAIQGVRLQNTEDIANNVVFLIDVSGSMNRPDRLPLVIDSMNLLLDQLNENDVISIITYAGTEQILADSVPGSEREKLSQIINGLRAEGSTAGGQALRQAYELASRNFIEGGNNRIILATDGDFNVGERTVDDMINLIESYRDRGIYISVLGYGMGNLNDRMMEAIAAHGNGNYAYIDTIQEARRVLVYEFDSTMFTIANDVRIQVEFNPEIVAAYRLIGYDTRRMENEDFNNESVNAGDIGSGHNVTAFFELIPVGVESGDNLVDPLRYSTIVTTGSDEYMVVRVRYVAPGEDESRLIERVVGAEDFRGSYDVSDNFLFASAVAEFGLIITDSQYRGYSSLDSVLARASRGMGEDRFGLRSEFIDLVHRYAGIVNW